MNGTIDNFLDGRIQLVQPSSGYRAGIDPLFLGAAVHPKKQEKILDVGCGVGTAAISLGFRYSDIEITGIEVQPDLCEFALTNIKLNQLMDRIHVIHSDILSMPSFFKDSVFDQVMTNPPYYKNSHGKTSPFPGKAQANTETVDLGEWIKFCFNFLKPRGTFTMIHRAERLDEILVHLENRAGNVVVYPLWPSADKPARRVIIQARKGAGGEMRLAKGLILHSGGKKYSVEAEAILRHAYALIL